MTNRTWPSLALVFNALVFGVSWWPFRALQNQGLHPLWATAFIFLFSVACIQLVRPGGWRAFAGQPLLWLLFAASGLTNVCFNWAVAIGDVVRVVLLFYVMPAWSVLLAWPLLREKPNAGSLFRLVLALSGVVIVLKTPDSPWPLPTQLADWLALLGGFTFALTNILLKKMADTPESARMLAMFGGGAVMATAVALMGTTIGLVNLPPAPALGWLGLAVATGLAILLGNLALQFGAARLSASATALIMLTEIIFASASASWLGAGEITLRTLIGAGLILLASLLSVLEPARASH